MNGRKHSLNLICSYFFVNVLLICHCSLQIVGFCHLFKSTQNYYSVTCSMLLIKYVSTYWIPSDCLNHMRYQTRFHLLTVTDMMVTVFWDVTSQSVVQTDLTPQGCLLPLKYHALFYQTTKHNIPTRQSYPYTLLFLQHTCS
jgi:hypothetical protein